MAYGCDWVVQEYTEAFRRKTLGVTEGGQEATQADTFAKAGMTVIAPDMDSFRKPVLAKLPPMFEAKWGKGLWDRLQAF